MTLAAGLALVSELIYPDERGRAIGLYMGVVAALPALGPVLSGALVDLPPGGHLPRPAAVPGAGVPAHLSPHP
jgi:MFS family permease